MDNESLTNVLIEVEKSVDSSEVLTRKDLRSDFVSEAFLTFSRGLWTVKVNARHVLAKGRGSKMMFGIGASDESIEGAVAKFKEDLHFWGKSLA